MQILVAQVASAPTPTYISATFRGSHFTVTVNDILEGSTFADYCGADGKMLDSDHKMTCIVAAQQVQIDDIPGAETTYVRTDEGGYITPSDIITANKTYTCM